MEDRDMRAGEIGVRKKIGKGAAIAAVVFVYWFLDTLLRPSRDREAYKLHGIQPTA
jgi:hypothetical protein